MEFRHWHVEFSGLRERWETGLVNTAGDSPRYDRVAQPFLHISISKYYRSNYGVFIKGMTESPPYMKVVKGFIFQNEYNFKFRLYNIPTSTLRLEILSLASTFNCDCVTKKNMRIKKVITIILTRSRRNTFVSLYIFRRNFVASSLITPYI
jgi:hypothetical protein